MQVYSEQLIAAWHLVQRGSRAAGVDGMTIDLFAGVATEQIQQLQRQLQHEFYFASPAKGFWLAKPSGGQRLIGLSTVRDRLVQRYLLQQIYPALERTFSEAAFAYRPGLSIDTAVERVMARYQQQPNWVIKADIQQFFDNLTWALLLNQLERLRLDPSVVRWIEQQLKAGMVLEGQVYRPNRGVLQGGILSGALANLYLSQFDRQCLEASIELVRYGDDCVAVCQSALEAHRSLALMHDWLADIYLTLHPERTQLIGPGEVFTFLGHQFANGRVHAPERRQPKAAQPRADPLPASRPPKVCSLVRPTKRPTGSTDEYWRDGMTTLYVTDQGAYLRVHTSSFRCFMKTSCAVVCL